MTLPISHPLDLRPYFFDQGICFECRQCGACCVGDPGTIYLSEGEINIVIKYLGMDREGFIDRFCYPFKDSYSLGEDCRGRCLFFDNGCTIYPVRPMQCRTFPFWFSNVRSQARWCQIQQQCPGIGTGPCYSRDQILTIVRSTMHL
jgi:uncharacterized protein